MDYYEVIRTTASVVSAFGIGIAVVQLFLARRVWKTQHERSRREKAVAVIHEFTKSDNSRWAAASKLVEELDRKALKALDRGESFQILPEQRDMLYAAIPSALSETVLTGDPVAIHLNARQVFLLRWETLSYLNAVEVVCQAWKRDVAHRPTIEQEMAFLYDPSRDSSVMEAFREIGGGRRYYPAIYDLVARLKELQKAEEPDKQIDD